MVHSNSLHPKFMKQLKSLVAVASALLLTSFLAHAQNKKPLKVFILAGQSNMVGMADVETIEAIGLDPATAPMLGDLLDKDGKPIVHDQVTICQPSKGEGDTLRPERFGRLEVGYAGGKGTSKVGPEFGFGIYAHKLLGEPILIIKTAQGGRDLVNDFRTPSAGPRDLTDEQVDKLKQANKLPGHQYRWMMEYIKKVLADPKRVCPDYDPEAGYELAGFAWFQGYNDFIGGGYPYVDPNGDKSSLKDYSEYTRLLGCFIRDIRKELDAPKLPFVIGVFGMDGKEAKGVNVKAFRKAQAATAELPEFKGNVVNVFTENYWPEDIDQIMADLSAVQKSEGKHLEGKALEAWKAYSASEALMKSKGKKSEADVGLPIPKNEKTGEPLSGSSLYKHRYRLHKQLRDEFHLAYLGPEKHKLLVLGSSDQSYHYWGSAKFYTLAGKAFAETLVGMQAK